MINPKILGAINKQANRALVEAHHALRNIERRCPQLIGSEPYNELQDMIQALQKELKDLNNDQT